MKQTCLKILKKFFLYYVLLNFAISFPVMLVMIFTSSPEMAAGVGCVLLFLVYFLIRKKIDAETVAVNAGIFGLDLLLFSILMLALNGNGDTAAMLGMNVLLFPFFVASSLMALMLRLGSVYTLILCLVFSAAAASYMALCIREKKVLWWRKMIAFLLITAILISGDTVLYRNRDEVKYGGHGFKYMHGYSSTDFSDYMVYSEPSRLSKLEKEADLKIEGKENMPVLDGAEACYPLYAAMAKAIYVDIDTIELEAVKRAEQRGEPLYRNGEVVTFTNTLHGFLRLIWKEIDLFFGAYPSPENFQSAAESGTRLNCTQIGKEAFVFFVEEDNPVTDLSSEEIRAIYRGDITNWAQLGGKNEEIRAFQRPSGSGSQTMMEYFMGDSPLKEPQTYELFSAMDGVIREVAQYADEAGAMGYSFRYFVEELSQEKNVRILSVDGVAPTLENIENGTYPLTVGLYLISREENENAYVQQVIDFMLSEQGQELVRKTGYAPLQ